MAVPGPQPRVMAAVQLDQHAPAGHALAAYPVLEWATSARTFQACADQDAPQGGAAHLYALALTEKLTQVGVAGAGDRVRAR